MILFKEPPSSYVAIIAVTFGISGTDNYIKMCILIKMYPYSAKFSRGLIFADFVG